jgi:hypothetical protein
MIDKEYLEEKVSQIVRRYEFTAKMVKLTGSNKRDNNVYPIDTRSVLSIYRGLCEMKKVLEIYNELYPNNKEVINGIRISDKNLSDIEEELINQIHKR